MPNYENHELIIQRNLDNPKFGEFIMQMKKEFDAVYPNCEFQICEKTALNAFNSGMNAHMTMSEKHYD